jgi:hypothetical protein
LKRTLSFILIISAAILAACVAGDTTPPQGSTDTAVQQSVPDVVARVNGSDITRADYAPSRGSMGPARWRKLSAIRSLTP